MDRTSFSMQVTVCLVIEGPNAEETRNALERAIHKFGALSASVGCYGGVHVTKGERTLTSNTEEESAALRAVFAPMCDTPAHAVEMETYIREIQEMRVARGHGAPATDDVSETRESPRAGGNGSALN